MSTGPKPPALRCSGIVKRFGALAAVDGVDFDVRAGEIHALVGENGAGKSTLMNMLYGVLSPDQGTIEVHGQRVRFANCADAMRAGIGMVFQHYLLVERFSVAENVVLGCEPAVRGFVDRRAAVSSVQELATKYRFSIDASKSVEALGVGARQQVELLRVLGRGPDIVILDEPTATLSPGERDGLFEVMERLRDEGRAVIFITHKLNEVMRVCDRVTVLRRGKVVATVDRAAASEAALATMMVGTLLHGPVRRPQARCAPVLLEICDLSVSRDDGSPAISGIGMVCRAGEIVGIAGVEGNGQVEFAEAVYGIRPPAAGTIRLDGADITHALVPERRRAGLRYISPDRQREGLVLEFDAVENAMLGDERSQRRGALLDIAAGRKRSADIAHDFAIDSYDPASAMSRYSGGTQQKFLVGRETADLPRVVIAFAPTRGVDISAAQSIYERLERISASGSCIVLISYDLDEIRALADRVLVFHRGSIAGDLPMELADDAALGRLMGSGAP